MIDTFAVVALIIIGCLMCSLACLLFRLFIAVVELIEELNGISEPFKILLDNDRSINAYYYNVREAQLIEWKNKNGIN